jgi:hypothetical protein
MYSTFVLFLVEQVKFHGEELKIYGERMTVLQKAYNELLVLSNKRVSDLHSLYDFMQVRTVEKTKGQLESDIVRHFQEWGGELGGGGG